MIIFKIEYTIVKVDPFTQKATLSLCYDELIKQFEQLGDKQVDFKPEYAKWMIEGTPLKPYGSSIQDLLKVEKNMIHRYTSSQLNNT